MYTTWTKHINDPDNKSKFEGAILNSKEVLDRLVEIIKETEEAVDRTETDIKDFDNPNWSHKQAFKNGYRSGLLFVKKLIDLDQQNKGKQ